jgi:hypothetical protein
MRERRPIPAYLRRAKRYALWSALGVAAVYLAGMAALTAIFFTIGPVSGEGYNIWAVVMLFFGQPLTYGVEAIEPVIAPIVELRFGAYAADIMLPGIICIVLGTLQWSLLTYGAVRLWFWWGRTRTTGLCKQCGYDRRGGAGPVCPECGRSEA